MIEKRIITDRDEWLSWRRDDVTASDIGALVGIHDYKTILQVYAEKSGQMLGALDDNSFLRRGRWAEGALDSAMAEKYPLRVIEKPNYYLRDPVRRIGCTPDRVMGGGKVNIQYKSVDYGKWKTDWQDGPPFAYQLQTLCEAMLQDSERSILAVLITGRGWDYEEYDVPRNAQAEARLIEAVESFWRDIDTGYQPEPDLLRDGQVIKWMAPILTGTEMDFSEDNQLMQYCADYDEAREHLKAWGDAQTVAKNGIIHKTAGCETVKCGPYKIKNHEVKVRGFEVQPRTDRRCTITQPKGNF